MRALASKESLPPEMGNRRFVLRSSVGEYLALEVINHDFCVLHPISSGSAKIDSTLRCFGNVFNFFLLLLRPSPRTVASTSRTPCTSRTLTTSFLSVSTRFLLQCPRIRSWFSCHRQPRCSISPGYISRTYESCTWESSATQQSWSRSSQWSLCGHWRDWNTNVSQRAVPSTRSALKS